MDIDFQDRILVARPNIKSPIFARTVIYIYQPENSDSIHGYILNMSLSPKYTSRWIKRIEWNYPDRCYYGGPVNHEVGHVIHSPDYCIDNTMPLNEYISMTTQKTIIDDINNMHGPTQFNLHLGHCVWHPLQLINEIQHDQWWITDIKEDMFFNHSEITKDKQWRKAIAAMACEETIELIDNIWPDRHKISLDISDFLEYK